MFTLHRKIDVLPSLSSGSESSDSSSSSSRSSSLPGPLSSVLYGILFNSKDNITLHVSNGDEGGAAVVDKDDILLRKQGKCNTLAAELLAKNMIPFRIQGDVFLVPSDVLLFWYVFHGNFLLSKKKGQTQGGGASGIPTTPHSSSTPRERPVLAHGYSLFKDYIYTVLLGLASQRHFDWDEILFSFFTSIRDTSSAAYSRIRGNARKGGRGSVNIHEHNTNLFAPSPRYLRERAAMTGGSMGDMIFGAFHPKVLLAFQRRFFTWAVEKITIGGGSIDALKNCDLENVPRIVAKVSPNLHVVKFITCISRDAKLIRKGVNFSHGFLFGILPGVIGATQMSKAVQDVKNNCAEMCSTFVVTSARGTGGQHPTLLGVEFSGGGGEDDDSRCGREQVILEKLKKAMHTCIICLQEGNICSYKHALCNRCSETGAVIGCPACLELWLCEPCDGCAAKSARGLVIVCMSLYSLFMNYDKGPDNMNLLNISDNAWAWGLGWVFLSDALHNVKNFVLSSHNHSLLWQDSRISVAMLRELKLVDELFPLKNSVLYLKERTRAGPILSHVASDIRDYLRNQAPPYVSFSLTPYTLYFSAATGNSTTSSSLFSSSFDQCVNGDVIIQNGPLTLRRLGTNTIPPDIVSFGMDIDKSLLRQSAERQQQQQHRIKSFCVVGVRTSAGLVKDGVIACVTEGSVFFTFVANNYGKGHHSPLSLLSRKTDARKIRKYGRVKQVWVDGGSSDRVVAFSTMVRLSDQDSLLLLLDDNGKCYWGQILVDYGKEDIDDQITLELEPLLINEADVGSRFPGSEFSIISVASLKEHKVAALVQCIHSGAAPAGAGAGMGFGTAASAGGVVVCAADTAGVAGDNSTNSNSHSVDCEASKFLLLVSASLKKSDTIDSGEEKIICTLSFLQNVASNISNIFSILAGKGVGLLDNRHEWTAYTSTEEFNFTAEERTRICQQKEAVKYRLASASIQCGAASDSEEGSSSSTQRQEEQQQHLLFISSDRIAPLSLFFIDKTSGGLFIASHTGALVNFLETAGLLVDAFLLNNDQTSSRSGHSSLQNCLDKCKSVSERVMKYSGLIKEVTGKGSVQGADAALSTVLQKCLAWNLMELELVDKVEKSLTAKKFLYGKIDMQYVTTILTENHIALVTNNPHVRHKDNPSALEIAYAAKSVLANSALKLDIPEHRGYVLQTDERGYYPSVLSSVSTSSASIAGSGGLSGGSSDTSNHHRGKALYLPSIASMSAHYALKPVGNPLIQDDDPILFQSASTMASIHAVTRNQGVRKIVKSNINTTEAGLAVRNSIVPNTQPHLLSAMSEASLRGGNASGNHNIDNSSNNSSSNSEERVAKSIGSTAIAKRGVRIGGGTVLFVHSDRNDDGFELIVLMEDRTLRDNRVTMKGLLLEREENETSKFRYVVASALGPYNSAVVIIRRVSVQDVEQNLEVYSQRFDAGKLDAGDVLFYMDESKFDDLRGIAEARRNPYEAEDEINDEEKVEEYLKARQKMRDDFQRLNPDSTTQSDYIVSGKRSRAKSERWKEFEEQQKRPRSIVTYDDDDGDDDDDDDNDDDDK